MNTKRCVFYYLVMVLLVLAGCGGNGEETAENVPAADDEAGEQQSAREMAEEVMSTSEIATAMKDEYTSALSDVIELLKDRPEAEAANADLEALKERYIQKMLDFGKKRAALSAMDQADLDVKISLGLNTISGELFTNYADAQKYYAGTPTGELIASFNVIYQYANFDYLKTNMPAEAARLGIQ